MGEKDGGGWGQTQPGAPAPNPSRTSISPSLGDREGPSRLRRRCVLHLHIPGWAGGGVCGVVDELVVDGVGEEVRLAGGDRPPLRSVFRDESQMLLRAAAQAGNFLVIGAER